MHPEFSQTVPVSADKEQSQNCTIMRLWKKTIKDWDSTLECPSSQPNACTDVVVNLPAINPQNPELPAFLTPIYYLRNV
jgi:hypothetical protein